MAEWFNAPVSKTGMSQGIGGSNPPTSAVSAAYGEDSKDFSLPIRQLAERWKSTSRSIGESSHLRQLGNEILPFLGAYFSAFLSDFLLAP